jgi:hypothetical protein
MIVKTTYPIIVNRKRVSPKDYYLNIDAKNLEEVKAFQRYAVSRGVNLDYISKSTKKLVSGENAIDGIYGGKTKNAYATYGADWEKTRTTPTPTPTDETKKEETKKEETKKEETKKEETKKEETKKDETKKEETKKDEVTITKDDKGNTTTVTKKADGTTTTVVTDKNGKVISKKQSGMSKNLKIGLIIGGGVLFLGIIIFALTRKNK